MYLGGGGSEGNVGRVGMPLEHTVMTGGTTGDLGGSTSDGAAGSKDWYFKVEMYSSSLKERDRKKDIDKAIYSNLQNDRKGTEKVKTFV